MHLSNKSGHCLIPLLGWRGLWDGVREAELKELGCRQRQRASIIFQFYDSFTKGDFSSTIQLRGVTGKLRWALPSEEAGSEVQNGSFALQRAEHTQVVLNLAELHGMQHLHYRLAGYKERSSDISGFILDVEICAYEDQYLKIRDWGWHGAPVDLFCMIFRDIVLMPVSHITVKPHMPLPYSKPKEKTYFSMFFGTSHYWYILQA